MQDELDYASDDEHEYVAKKPNSSLPNPTLIIKYATSDSKNDQSFRPDTFDYDIMFIEVEPHRKKISPGKYNDTVMGMSAVYTDREFSSSEMRDGKSLTNNNVLPKNILSEEEDENEGESKSEEGEEKMTFYGVLREEKDRRHKMKVLQQLEKEESEDESEQSLLEVNYSSIEQNDSQLHLSLENTYFFDSKTPFSEDLSGSMKEDKEKFEKDKLAELEHKPWKKLILRLKYENCRKISIKEIETPLRNREHKLSQYKRTAYLEIYKSSFMTHQPASDNDSWHFGDAKEEVLITVVKLQCFQCHKKKIALITKENAVSVTCDGCYTEIVVEFEVSLQS